MAVVATLAAMSSPLLPEAEASHCALAADGSEGCTITCAAGFSWAVDAGFASGSANDRVIGQLRCGTTGNWFRLSSCTATFDGFSGGGHCQSGFNSTDSTDPAFCRLIVSDYPDNVALADPYAVCYDPVDPSRFIEATIEIAPPRVS